MSFFLWVLVIIAVAVIALALAAQLFTRGRRDARREQELSGVSAEKPPGSIGPDTTPLG